MSCGRCGAGMLKTELYVSQKELKAKMVSAWRCHHCGRIEYYSGQTLPEARAHEWSPPIAAHEQRPSLGLTDASDEPPE